MFEMFNRLNTGGVNLNPQEIRASLYHSKFFDKLFELNQASKWRELLGTADPDSRMKDMEIILRSLALRGGTEGYAGSMTAFVNRYCKTSKSFDPTVIEKTSDEWAWFLSLNAEGNADTYKAGSSRFSPLLFESVYCAALSLRDEGVELTSIKPKWVSAIGRHPEFTKWQQEGSTKTENVKSRLTSTRALLLDASKGAQ